MNRYTEEMKLWLFDLTHGNLTDGIFILLIILQILLCIVLISWIIILISYIANNLDFPFYYPECKPFDMDREIQAVNQKHLEIEKNLEERRNWKPDKTKYYVSGKPWKDK